MRIVVPPGCYRPLLDSVMLADAIRGHGLAPGASVLDVCTGSGVLAVTAALCGGDVTAVDVSRRAVLAAAANARLNRVRVRALRGTLFEPVADERFDCIVSNPPYVPAQDAAPPVRGRARAWDGGTDGRLLLDRLCKQAPGRLRPGGTLLLVHTAHIGEDRTLQTLRDAGFDAEIVDRRREPLGPVMRRRVAAGLLPPGIREDELVVIAARAAVAAAPPAEPVAAPATA